MKQATQHKGLCDRALNNQKGEGNSVACEEMQWGAEKLEMCDVNISNHYKKNQEIETKREGLEIHRREGTQQSTLARSLAILRRAIRKNVCVSGGGGTVNERGCCMKKAVR